MNQTRRSGIVNAIARAAKKDIKNIFSIIVLASIIGLGASTAEAASTSAMTAGTVATGVSYLSTPPSPTSDWVGATVASLSSSGSSNSTATIGSDSQTYFMKLSNFGFSVPAGATIDGIQVNVLKRGSASGQGITDQYARIVKGGTIGTTDKAKAGTWSTSFVSSAYGSSTEKWGESWTAADINSSSFGFAFAAHNEHSSQNRTATVDHVTVTVFYTVAAAPVITINPYSTAPTNLDVAVTATTSAGTLNAVSHTFTANGSFDFVATSAGGTSTSTVTITNIDKVAPVIAAHADIGPVEATSNLGASVTYSNPAVTDNADLSAVSSCAAPSGSTFALGTTGVICNSTDNAGNAATSTTFNILVVDTTAPVIVLTGLNPLTVEGGSVFTDPGAVATDNSGNFAATSTGSVNTNVVGAYVLTYTATDASGNAASSTTRTVNVVDTTGPAAPAIISPLNNSIHKTVNLTSIDWNDVADISGPVTYTYSVSNSSSATNIDGSLVSPIYTAASLPVSEIATPNTPPAVYYVQVRATDSLGNAGPWSVPIQITVDNTAPVITVDGTNPLTIEGGSAYVEAGATAADAVDGSFAAIPSGSVNTSAVGTYTITYNATDTAGNAAVPVTRTVYVIDTTAPVITITGANPMTLEGGSAYVEAGATATDNVSAPVTVIATGTVDIYHVGTYLITYNATDASGNAASSTVRTVNVVDTTAPVIHMNGQNPDIVTINNPYVDSGATASDLIDGSRPVSSTSTVNTSVLGSYAVIYTATDLTGNSASSTRVVTVIPPDTTAPIITILGSNPVTHEGGSAYVDGGATAADNVSGNLTPFISATSTVNASAVGSYSVTYTVSDGAGNAAIPGIRTVNVVDTTDPVITLNGASIIALHTGDPYVELGATVSDSVDPSVSVVIGGDTVTTTATSTFTITYNATDASGNAAATVTRTVVVDDISVPLITLVGTGTIAIEYGSVYTDAGATALDDADGDISANVMTTGVVNTGALGTYVLTYSVSDSSGNVATPIIRTVNVVDTTAPVVTVNGSSTISLIVGDAYADLGATAIDIVDGTLTATTTDSVDTATPTTYVLIYSATDLSGNIGTTSRTVVVSAAPDTIAPVISLLGSNPLSITVGTAYSEAGATTTDNVDSSVPVTISGSVNSNVIGTYTITYNATDTAGNAATPIARTVNVVAAPSAPQTGFGESSGGGGSSGISSFIAATTTASTTPGRVLGVETFSFSKNLRYGMRNNDVLELQKRLVAEGFLKVTPTGYFGSATRNAVKLYQAAHKIKPVSGFVGPLTRAELNK